MQGFDEFNTKEILFEIAYEFARIWKILQNKRQHINKNQKIESSQDCSLECCDFFWPQSVQILQSKLNLRKFLRRNKFRTTGPILIQPIFFFRKKPNLCTLNTWNSPWTCMGWPCRACQLGITLHIGLQAVGVQRRNFTGSSTLRSFTSAGYGNNTLHTSQKLS